ncbi:MAG: hypothetical protein ACO21F_06660 [Ilumatobacteraceae bacterium]
MSSDYGTVDPTQNAAEERLGRLIARVLIVVGVLAAVSLVMPNGDVVGWISVSIAMAIPVARVGWLAIRWARIRDTRYVIAAVILLVLIAVGPVVALLSS